MAKKAAAAEVPGTKTYYSARKGLQLMQEDLMATGPTVGGQVTVKMIPQTPVIFVNGKYTTRNPREQELIESNIEFGDRVGGVNLSGREVTIGLEPALSTKEQKSAEEEARIEAEVLRRLNAEQTKKESKES